MSRQTQMSRRPIKKARCMGKKGRKLKITHFNPKRGVRPLAKVPEYSLILCRTKHSKQFKKKKKIASHVQKTHSDVEMAPTQISNRSKHISKSCSPTENMASNKRTSTPSHSATPTTKCNSDGQAAPRWSSQTRNSYPYTQSKERHSPEQTFSLNNQKKAARFKVNWTNLKKSDPVKLCNQPYRYKSPVSAKSSMAAWYREADDHRRKLHAHNEREKARGRLNVVPLPCLTPVIPKGLSKPRENALNSMMKSVPQMSKGKSGPRLLKTKSIPQLLKAAGSGKPVPQPLLTMIKKALAKHPTLNNNVNIKASLSGGAHHSKSNGSRAKSAHSGRQKKRSVSAVSARTKHSRSVSKNGQLKRDAHKKKHGHTKSLRSTSRSAHSQSHQKLDKWRFRLPKSQHTFSNSIPRQPKLPTWRSCVCKPKSCFPKSPRSTSKHVKIQQDLPTLKRVILKPKRHLKPQSSRSKSQGSRPKSQVFRSKSIGSLIKPLQLQSLPSQWKRSDFHPKSHSSSHASKVANSHSKSRRPKPHNSSRRVPPPQLTQPQPQPQPRSQSPNALRHHNQVQRPSQDRVSQLRQSEHSQNARPKSPHHSHSSQRQSPSTQAEPARRTPSHHSKHSALRSSGSQHTKQPEPYLFRGRDAPQERSDRQKETPPDDEKKSERRKKEIHKRSDEADEKEIMDNDYWDKKEIEREVQEYLAAKRQQKEHKKCKPQIKNKGKSGNSGKKSTAHKQKSTKRSLPPSPRSVRGKSSGTKPRSKQKQRHG